MGVSYSLLQGWGPHGGRGHGGDPTEAAAAAPAGSGGDGDIGEPVLTGKSLYSCSQGRVRRRGRRCSDANEAVIIFRSIWAV